MSQTTSYQREIKIFKKNSGFLKTALALKSGIHPRTLYAMRDAGVIECIGRGLYRLNELPIPSNPDMVTISYKIPQGVLCLISALAFHEITTQVPHEIYIALKKGTERPRLKYPPVQFFWLSESSFNEGIENRKVGTETIKIYCAEKTVADCFKFRNRIGIDVAIEALKLCIEKKRSKPDLLLKYAKICRVENVMRPYLEALL